MKNVSISMLLQVSFCCNHQAYILNVLYELKSVTDLLYDLFNRYT